MKFGMQSFKMEDDIALDPVTPVENAEVMVDAQEAQADINEVVQLTDAVEEYVSVSEDLDGVQDEAIEVIESNPSEEVAEEAAVKLERDLNGILCRINGVATSSRFASGMLGRRQESDFKLKGKKGLIAKTESISDMGKKVWEHIKAFFAKIWDFMKSLFERFTALFKSNKSVLEGLKKKLESEEDSKYDSIKKDAKESQQLTFYYKHGKEYVASVGKVLEVFKDTADKALAAAKDSANAKAEDKGAALVKELEGAVTSGFKVGDKITLSSGDFDGLKNTNSFFGFGVNGEGIVGFTAEINDGKYKLTSKTAKFKKGAFEKEKNLREALIDICDYGIDLCSELDGSLIKDAEKEFNDFKKEADDFIKEMFEKKGNEDGSNRGDQAAQKLGQNIITNVASTFSKIVATVGQQPSQVVTAVRNGMSMCEPAKK